MCSRPHFTGKPDWPRADFAENCLLRAGSKASAVSRFREKLSPANGVQGITAISQKIALLGVMSAKLAAIKWGPTYDRDISDSAIYTTAIYRAYTVLITHTHILIFSKEYKILRKLQPHEPGQEFFLDLGVKDVDNKASLCQLSLIAGAILKIAKLL